MVTARTSLTLAGLIAMLAGVPTAGAEPATYTRLVEFRAALTALGYGFLEEGFEDDEAWGHVRSSVPGGNQTAPSVTNLGITWTANNDVSEVTTGPGPARRGMYGFFVLPHGSFGTGIDCSQPVVCGDGWIGTAGQTLYAIGGWIETNTPPATLGLYLDDSPVPVDFGESCDPGGENCVDLDILDTQHRFFGVIDPAGFQQFQFRELEAAGDEAKFMFADDFIFSYGAVGDTDGDGIADDSDNCRLLANPDQRDTDDDAIGNVCDTDLNGDCVVNFGDLAEFKAAFFPGPYSADADFDGDGFVNFGDLATLKAGFFTAPMPGPGPGAPGNACE